MKRLIMVFALALLAPAVVAQTPPPGAPAAVAGDAAPPTGGASATGGVITPTPPANGAARAPAASAGPFRLNIGLEGAGEKGEVSVALQILIVMTLLSVAPSIVLLMTSFTRIVIVLGFVRTALGTPSNVTVRSTRWQPSSIMP